MNIRAGTSAVLAGLLLVAGCQDRAPRAPQVKVDGSSTVAPIAMAAAELYRAQRSDVHVTVGISGTGGGFKKFLDARPDLRTDINDASRSIQPSEIEKAAAVGVEFIEVPIALDGISIVVNPKNTFCDHLTVAELRKIWDQGSSVSNWKDVRAGFPDLPLRLFGPGQDSGTFDYFTEVVNGKEKRIRDGYSPSAYPNVLVQGVAGDAGALGFFGFSYYEANSDKLKLLAIDGGDGKPIKPSMQSIRDGTYRPLSRPLFLYISKAAAGRPEVAGFLEFCLTNGKSITEDPKVGYVALPDNVYAAGLDRIKRTVTGSPMAKAGHTGPLDLMELYGVK